MLPTNSLRVWCVWNMKLDKDTITQSIATTRDAINTTNFCKVIYVSITDELVSIMRIMYEELILSIYDYLG
jgi:hypothetical protein